MGVRHRVVPAEPRHVAALAERLRAADAAEIEAAGIGARKAVWRSYRGSFYARTAFVDDDIAAMWGVGGSPLGRTCHPWLLTTPAVERVPLAFLKVGRAETALMLSFCEELRGYVDAAYSRALRLLEAFGFSLSDEFPFGPKQAPFRMYSMRRP